MNGRWAPGGVVGGGGRGRAGRLAALVRGHRRAAGLTQGELAGLSGVSLAAIRDLEQGRRHRPRAGSLAALAGALGLEPAQAAELARLAGGGAVAGDLAVAGGGHLAGGGGVAVGGPGAAGVAGGQLGAAGGLRLRVLGPLAGWRGGVRLALGGPRQQAVLGMVALAPGSLVHRAAIIDVLWPQGPPATAVAVVQSHVSRLRALLDGGRGGRGRGGVLVSAGACYGLRAGPGELDLVAFGQLAAAARAARQAGDHAGACEGYQRALGLWRGEPLAGVDLLAGHPELIALARRRAEVVIEYAQAASAAGWHERVLAPLWALARREPLNERAHAQLMIALAGSGQQAEALELFEELRRRLDAELAMPPGPDLAGVSRQEARAALGELTAAHLLTEHAPDRFTCHDLLRAYAAEQADTLTSHAERRAALHRMLGHYLHSARAANRRLYPARPPITIDPPAAGMTPEDFTGHAQALAWFDTEHQVLLAAVSLAAGEGFDACAWQLAWTLETFFYRRAHLHDWATAQRSALAAARRLGDGDGQACAHRGIGGALALLGDWHDASSHLRQALVLRRRLGDRAGQAELIVDFSRHYERRGWLRRSLRSAQQAIGMYRELGDRWGEARALNHAGWPLARLGDYGQALVCCQQALVIMVALGDRHNAADTLGSLGYAHRHLGHHAPAAACYRRAVHLFAELGSRYKRAETLTYAGDAYRAAGDPLAARDAWQEALHILDELQNPDISQLRAKLRALATGQPPGLEPAPPPPAAARR
jgi:DNA-binding SARP family transcriptional activator